MKGQMLSSAALSEWMFIYFAERQEGHPKEGLGWQCKRGQKILTSGYRAHGPAKAEQFCIVVYFSLRWPRNPHFQMGFLPSSRRWHNLLSLQLLWGVVLVPFALQPEGMCFHLTSHQSQGKKEGLICPVPACKDRLGHAEEEEEWTGKNAESPECPGLSTAGASGCLCCSGKQRPSHNCPWTSHLRGCVRFPTSKSGFTA